MAQLVGHVRIQMGGRGADPLKYHTNIGFLSKTGLDPLENHKATKLAFNVGPYQPTSEIQSGQRERNALLHQLVVSQFQNR